MAPLHKVLIGVQTEADPQLLAHKRVAKQIYRMTDMHAVSAVYHFFAEDEEGFSVVYSLRTKEDPASIYKTLKEIESSVKSSALSIQLLVFGEFVLRAVDLVVPSLELHRLKRWCVPAAELWGDYVHPVEQKELKILSEHTGSKEKLEFFAQSKTLLDFLAAQP